MISFIVPAHNEQASLGRTLEAIHKAARAVGQPYEIIATAVHRPFSGLEKARAINEDAWLKCQTGKRRSLPNGCVMDVDGSGEK